MRLQKSRRRGQDILHRKSGKDVKKRAGDDGGAMLGGVEGHGHGKDTIIQQVHSLTHLTFPLIL